uniref:Protein DETOXIFICATION n=1 Tax=Fagus sylvatica TaxID=28930 RepID=A0A2N9FDA3_FAGSY
MEPDRMRWKLRKNGTFDSRSLYFALRGANGVHFPWKSIWGAKAPQRVSFFVWTATWGRILTCDNLMRRGEGGGALIWVEELVWKHESGVWNLVPLCLMWKIWKERNSRIFEDKASSMDQLKGAFVNALFDWARVSGFTTTILVTEVVHSVYALLLRLLFLWPATVVCDYMSYSFMFLSIATSNMVATALARKDKNEVQHHISILLFVGLACGCLMLLFTKFFGAWALTAFTGPNNAHLVPAANTYVQIRGLAWPALLVGWVAQSASLGMKDSWGPLKALAVASAVNGIGDIVLCSFLGYGIAGAAWATMASQVIAGYMMIEALNKKGYNAFSISIPSPDELLTVLGLAAPVFITMMSKVAFYSLLIYFATSIGTYTMAAHQVMIQTFVMCTVWGAPLSQTAQTFMPELIYGVHRSLEKARMLLKSLVIIGAILGLLLGIVGTSVPWLFPKIFTHDQNVIQEMHNVLIPYFMALAITPPTYSLEGTLLLAETSCKSHVYLGCQWKYPVCLSYSGAVPSIMEFVQI